MSSIRCVSFEVPITQAEIMTRKQDRDSGLNENGTDGDKPKFWKNHPGIF